MLLSFIIKKTVVAGGKGQLMLKWSEYFQNSDYLEATRKFLIPEELRTVVVSCCGVKTESTVLDVGCGTGFFSRFLAKGEPTAHITGLEYDENFVDYARITAQKEELEISFVQGDALHLPFAAESFDAVTSHTFLTSIGDPEAALKEMLRVCKKGGTVSSVTAMSMVPSAIHSGYYTKECTWARPLKELENKMWTMYESINPIKNYLNQITTAHLPHMFAAAGLKKVSMYPIGKAFSLSDARFSHEDKMDYLDKMITAERQKLSVYMEMEEARRLFSREDSERYLALLEEKRRYYKTHPEENRIWEWNGGVNVLIWGKKEA